MSIAYKYEIIAVDEASRCMEVVYSAEGHKTVHVGARLPFQGEDLESVIAAFAPVSLWLELATPVAAPKVGVTGSVQPKPEPLPTPDPEQKQPTLPVTEL